MVDAPALRLGRFLLGDRSPTGPPRPIQGGDGATDPGPRDLLIDAQNSAALRPPATDQGSLPNLKVSFGMTHCRLEDGGMRELRWRPDADEWQFYGEGQARMTVCDATANARTSDDTAGDVSSMPHMLGHDIAKIGAGVPRIVNMVNSPHHKDISRNNWMALTPPPLVQGPLKTSTNRP